MRIFFFNTNAINNKISKLIRLNVRAGEMYASRRIWFSGMSFRLYPHPPCPCVQKTTNPVRLWGTKWECGGKKRGSNDRYVSQTERTSRIVPASRRNPRQDIAPRKTVFDLPSKFGGTSLRRFSASLQIFKSSLAKQAYKLVFFMPQH